jgi:DeoR/GlpR family transcriptional regulator of sugar metabolism
MDIEIPLTELDSDTPEIGSFGEITLKVEVMGVDKEKICLLKHDKIKISKPFKEMDLEEMKKRIGTVEDEVMPMNKDSEEKESD